MRKWLIAALLILPLSAADLTPAERERHIESFEYVWTTVRDKHWDSRYNGVDWQAVHDELRPRIERVERTADARLIIGEMLARLKQTHFGVIPAEEYKLTEAGEESGPASPRDGAAGIDVRFIGGRVLVNSVEKGSPAERAGVRPGFELLAIDGQELAPAVELISKRLDSGVMLALAVHSVALEKLRGGVGTPAVLRLREHDDAASFNVTVTRIKPRGIATQFGNLPQLYAWSETRRLRGDVGYFTFSLFFDPDNIMKGLADAIESCRACKGFILDLRGNRGGIAMMAAGIAGWFLDKKAALGTVHYRQTTLSLIANPRLEPFGGRLAILVDGCSVSSAEFLAGGLQEIGRGRVFGSRTVGAALPSVVEILPNGDRFQYAIAGYLSAGGKPLEGRGVLPDVVVEQTRESLLAGRDVALEAALDWIKTGPRP